MRTEELLTTSLLTYTKRYEYCKLNPLVYLWMCFMNINNVADFYYNVRTLHDILIEQEIYDI